MGSATVVSSFTLEGLDPNDMVLQSVGGNSVNNFGIINWQATLTAPPCPHFSVVTVTVIPLANNGASVNVNITN
jgi:hypothetical protein